MTATHITEQLLPLVGLPWKKLNLWWIWTITQQEFERVD